MFWYEGGIADAVKASKLKEAIFVVFIEGKDENSKKLTTIIDTEEVSKELQSDKFVAIKIEANSTPHHQFSQIYNNAPAPSIYFIGRTGAPLEIITSIQDSSELLRKIDTMLQKGAIVGTQSPLETAAKQSDDFLQSERNLDKPSPTEKYVCEGNVCHLVKDTKLSEESNIKQGDAVSKETKPKVVDDKKEKSSPEKEASTTELTAEEKTKRALELIEQQRKAKEREEEEKERQKEIERRQMGQNVQEMKKWQEDQKLKQILDEREKEKRENKIARDRVLAQIAQDKAERAAKFGSSPPSKPAPDPNSASPDGPKQEIKPVNYNEAKILFKLPDGSSRTHHFPSDATLTEIYHFLNNDLNLSPDCHALSMSFPKRDFGPEDDGKTLRELELVPDAVLLIRRLARNSVTPSAAVGGLTALIWTLLAPVLSIFSFMKGLVFGKKEEPQNKEPVKRTSDVLNGEGDPSVVIKRPRDSTVIRKEGNVHRLADRRDSDDENNTWNGNSTQQM